MKRFRLKYRNFPISAPDHADQRYNYYQRLARKEDADWLVLTAGNGPAFVMDDAELAIYRREALGSHQNYQVFPLRTPVQRLLTRLKRRFGR